MLKMCSRILKQKKAFLTAPPSAFFWHKLTRGNIKDNREANWEMDITWPNVCVYKE